MKEIWGKIAETGIARLYGLVVAMGTFAITARWLGPEGRGAVMAALTWAMLFCSFSYLSLGQVAIHHTTGKRDLELLKENFSALVAAGLSLTVLGWLIAWLLYLITGGKIFSPLAPSLVLVGFLALPFCILFQYFTCLLIAEGQISINNLAFTVSKTLSLVLLLLGWMLGLGIYSAIFILVAAEACSALIPAIFLARKLGWTFHLKLSHLTKLIKGGIRLHPSSIGHFLLMSTNLLIVTAISGTESAGYYQLAWQLITMGLILSDAASSVIYGKVAGLGPKEAWPLQRKTIFITSAIMLGSIVIGYLLAPFIIKTLGGDQFIPSVGIFRALLPILIIHNFTTIMSSQWVSRGLFVNWSASLLAAGVINISVAFLIVPKHESFGAVLANLISAVVILLPNVWLFRLNEREQATVQSPSPL